MTAKELMVGDLCRVNRDGLCIKKHTIVEIRAIDADDRLDEKNLTGSAHCRPLDEEQFDGGIWCEYLNPILLTPEILKKNGFTSRNKERWVWVNDDTRTEVYIWIPDGMPVEIRKNVYYEDEVVYTLPYVWAVHELQHTLRLCGIEKEIVL